MNQMRITGISGLFILLAVLGGCDNVFVGEGKYGLRFEQEYVFPSAAPLLEVFGGSNIEIIDTLLLVQHRHENPAYFWEVYNLNNLEPLKSILRRGRGPLEVLFAHYTGQYERVNDENWMFFLDMNSAKFMKINLTESLSGNDIIELVTAVDPEKSPCFAIEDDLFLYFDYHEDDKNLYLMKGDYSWENPEMVKKIYRNITNDDYNKLTHSVYYNKKSNKICIIPYYVDHIQIIDLGGNNDMILSTAESNTWQTTRSQNFESTTVFYGNSTVTDEYIFALYTNKKITEMDTFPEDVEIHVFNWAGDPVAKLRFENHITSFAVDAKNKVLYGMNHMEQIYAYDISAYLE
jgi:hypothetical protein